MSPPKYSKASPKDLREFGLAMDRSVADKPADKLIDKPIVEDKPKETKLRESKVYPGDAIEENTAPLRGNTYQTLNFATSIELFAFFESAIAEQKIKLNPWQAEIAQQLCSSTPTQQAPIRYCLCAANGSGKDAFVIAPFAIWFILTKIKSRCIITSSSGVQLTSQTENHIRNLASKINEYFGEQIFKINQRYIYCRLSGSEIRLFATDEAGKAEGYHPIDPGAEMAIIVNEAKSVSEDIFSALRRCTGYNYYILVSSPGEPKGTFYKAFCNWKLIRRVTSYDCLHLNPEEREEDLRDLGEASSLYRSKHLALFTSLEGRSVIPFEVIMHALNEPPDIFGTNWDPRIGIDIAAGGDENSISFVQGNVLQKQINFREKDTTVTADRIESLFNEWKLAKDYGYIYADDGGIGRAVIDMLVRRGWFIRRILNQWAALNKKEFLNRGAEMWYRVKRMFELNLLVLPTDNKKLHEQLYNRYYKSDNTTAKLALETKAQAKAHGRPSPDRADSYILALASYTLDELENAQSKQPSNELTRSMVFNNIELLKEHLFNGDTRPLRVSKKSHGSLNFMLENN